jgi:hypothetical protein
MVKQQFLVAVISLSSFLACSASAQSPALGARTNSPRDKAIEDKYRSDEIERVRRSAEKPKDRRTTRFPQIKDDFERIQIINSDVLQTNPINRPLDYRRIAEAGAEVSKRASRLKSNLFPTESNDGTKKTSPQNESTQDLKSLLKALDTAVIGFVHNPMFENLKVVNSQDSTKAQQDLESIIKLSREVNKRAKARDQ